MVVKKSILAQDRELLRELDIFEPRNWNRWTHEQRLDYIGGRILAGSRTTKSHNEMKEEGYLSHSQMKRRRDREVQSSNGMNEEELITDKRGQFSRAYKEAPPRKTLDYNG